jgi:hypothetical protein
LLPLSPLIAEYVGCQRQAGNKQNSQAIFYDANFGYQFFLTLESQAKLPGIF